MNSERLRSERRRSWTDLHGLQFFLLLTDFLWYIFLFVFWWLVILFQNATGQILLLLRSITPNRTEEWGRNQTKTVWTVTMLLVSNFQTCPGFRPGSWDTSSCLGTVSPQRPSETAASATSNTYLQVERLKTLRNDLYLLNKCEWCLPAAAMQGSAAGSVSVAVRILGCSGCFLGCFYAVARVFWLFLCG